MQVVGLSVKRLITDCGDEGFDRGVVDLLGLDPLGAGVARQTRQADVGSARLKIHRQLFPHGAQGRPNWEPYGLQFACLHKTRGDLAAAMDGEHDRRVVRS
jgi:hypothetical protein